MSLLINVKALEGRPKHATMTVPCVTLFPITELGIELELIRHSTRSMARGSVARRFLVPGLDFDCLKVQVSRVTVHSLHRGSAALMTAMEV